MSAPKTVSFHTLGCKLNYSETSSISRQFEQAGYQVVPFSDSADIYVLNTCSVTDFADRKCRYTVRKALRHSPNAKIVVIGCYAQLKPDEISKIEGVDLVLGAAEKFNVLEYVERLEKLPGKGMIKASDVQAANVFKSSFSYGDRTRSFLKVQDGCNYKCTFCTIPQARGKSRSDTIEQAVENAQNISKLGVKEIVLTGVNLGDFGNGTEVIEGKRPKKEAMFIDLIKALDEVDGIERFRISSIEPNLLTDEVIEFVAKSKRFVPHFHIPLQSGSDKILKLMKRRYLTDLYTGRVEKIKNIMPHCCIGVDVIVGFPSETSEDFLETFNYLRELDVSYLHVFTYSERANTPAVEIDHIIPMHTRKERNEQLRILSEKKKRQFYNQFVGEERAVLLEAGSEDGVLSGFTDNYLKVEVEASDALINTIQKVALKEVLANGNMMSEIVYQSEPIQTY